MPRVFAAALVFAGAGAACGLTADFSGLQGGGDAGVASSCASRSPAPTFCDDFDHESLPGAWDVFHQTGGTLTIDSDASASTPSSLLATYDPLQPGQLLDTALRKRIPLPAPQGTTTFAIAIRPDVVDPTPSAVLVLTAIDFFDAAMNRYSLQLAATQNGGTLAITLGEQSGFIDGGTAYVEHALADPLVVGAWTHVRLDVVRTGPLTATARLAFDGRTELDGVALQMTVDATSVEAAVGTTFVSLPSKGWTVRYDDVSVDLGP